MSEAFKLLDPQELTDNVFKLVGEDWMLITAGGAEHYNTMTASWGGLGILWHKKIAFCVVRPTRYTYEFMEASDTFSLSFFTEDYRSALEICGSASGRDMDKAEAADITPVEDTPGIVYFQEARLVLECRKLYYQDLDPAKFLDEDIHKMYPDKNYHRLYVGEITQVRIKE
ncbi:flavin reductase (DIM6/NTAB) family NADH-FMN oxidoreductase RutF [Paenibacillus forsythiae]|uniref:Flavin reductase (DIM6/NTAB) family NADH-FMN oxidoreductase RutF n=1 Tax=Paenibacillus forsythiae TaxID=365616 RepID=A0ABU3H9Z5_9BACL|nr:flavin reductase family protein [Paenibacillus forsythiae]MDT3427535.1 flavin reductase (DIM6/NTAB) family NADH-FMN oxidoreductase RutF [Paenibacillus forsythiae]